MFYASVLFSVVALLGLGASWFAIVPFAFGIASTGLLALGFTGLFLCRLNKKQCFYLDLVDREREELCKYNELLTGDDEGDDQGDESNSQFEDGLKSAEVKNRIDVAMSQLDQAKSAVRREQYVVFLSAYYWANAQRVFVYELLDEASSDREPHRLDWSLEIGLDWVTDQPIRKDGTIGVPADDFAGKRLYNLTKWIWVSKQSLPAYKQDEIDSYILDDDGELKRTATPQELYRAVLVIQGWDIQRISDLMNLRRFLRWLIPLVFGVLIFLPILGWGVVEANVPADLIVGETTSGADSVLFEPWYVTLVVVFGVLGSLFSMALSVKDATYPMSSYRLIPDPTVMREAIVVRLLVGGIAALVLFALLQSGIGAAVFDESLRDNALTILIVAFLAGYSERLVQRSLDNAEQMISVGATGETGTVPQSLPTDEVEGEPST
ncbi:hypothetical protein [Natronococcus wangiae]|uniref:hypothetical protein n=1 Tax=Natronococcus wangiae TaxID=3068275 RepID=UPI00273FF9BD|nr:hypothetical protein [Natronococcus sp. AD5]